MPRKLLKFVVSALAALLVIVTVRLASAQPQRAPVQQQQQVQSRARHATPAVPVRHNTAFRRIPGSAGLDIRAVSYNGATNGLLTVEVRNASATPQTFTAAGLYFIPEGDPDEAPQRLGAVGPIQIGQVGQIGQIGQIGGTELQKLLVPPGATKEVILHVFCIDSHRSSPSPQNKFHVAKTRMPRALASTIERKASAAVADERKKGTHAPRNAAKSKIQSEVWKSRDSRWIELDGEGQQEQRKR